MDLIDINTSPILEVTETGIRTEKEGVIPVDVLILATGFDTNTGGMAQINISNEKGEKLKERWETEGCSTMIGISAAGFPNMFFLCGPQGRY